MMLIELKQRINFLLDTVIAIKLETNGYILSVGDDIARVYGLYDVFFVELLLIPLGVFLIMLFLLFSVYYFLSWKFSGAWSCKLLCNSVFASLTHIDCFKDGRNLPLSLTLSVLFLTWSLRGGFLSQMPLTFQAIWLFFYSYSMYNFRYSLKSIAGRLPLITLLILLKLLIAPDFVCDVFSLVPHVYAPRCFLPVCLLDFFINQVAFFVLQRDYWALLLLVMPGFSAEYSYWQKDAFLLGFGSRSVALAGTFEEGVKKGMLIKDCLKSKIVCPDFQVYPQNMENLFQQILTDTTYSFYSSSNRFRVGPSRVNTADYFLPREGEGSFHFLRTKFAPIDTATIAAFKTSFTDRYPGLAKGIGEEYLGKLPCVMLQQAYHELTTGLAVAPSSKFFSQLLQSDTALKETLLQNKSINPFLTLAEQQTAVAKYLQTSDLKILEVMQTPLDCALVVKDVASGSVKALGIEVKSETLLNTTKINLVRLEPVAKNVNFVALANSGKFDEFVFLVHNVYKSSPEQQLEFQHYFDGNWGKYMEVKYKIVFQ